jgi:hypothetical protein
MEKIRIRDPGWKKLGSGILDTHPESATLLFRPFLFIFWLVLTFQTEKEKRKKYY